MVRIKLLKISKSRQQGAALFAGIVFTALLTGLAVTLLQSSVMDQKISAANAEQMHSMDKTIGGVSHVVYKAVNKQVGGQNFLTINQGIDTTTLEDEMSFKLDVATETGHSTNCRAEKQASSTTAFQCNSFHVEVVNKYGKSNLGKTTIRAGLMHQAMVVN
ncbi:hypothetical protein HR060_07480 [Catenovulum sp. SM1970]|uniref:pilus assembly PilX family protein n=1 Tax=Marinifaba aquimaris TaxID=2741323 RepID=UPI00157282D0|nr:hypothetical protein [Marinifaba aquimaris]NTS76708.1 hypothetical protein [Marinifaba aquimaris]